MHLNSLDYKIYVVSDVVAVKIYKQKKYTNLKRDAFLTGWQPQMFGDETPQMIGKDNNQFWNCQPLFLTIEYIILFCKSSKELIISWNHKMKV